MYKWGGVRIVDEEYVITSNYFSRDKRVIGEKQILGVKNRKKMFIMKNKTMEIQIISLVSDFIYD